MIIFRQEREEGVSERRDRIVLVYRYQSRIGREGFIVRDYIEARGDQSEMTLRARARGGDRFYIYVVQYTRSPPRCRMRSGTFTSISELRRSADAAVRTREKASFLFSPGFLSGIGSGDGGNGDTMDTRRFLRGRRDRLFPNRGANCQKPVRILRLRCNEKASSRSRKPGKLSYGPSR